MLEDFNNVCSLKTEVCYVRRGRHVKFLRGHVIKREGHIQTCICKKPITDCSPHKNSCHKTEHK